LWAAINLELLPPSPHLIASNNSHEIKSVLLFSIAFTLIAQKFPRKMPPARRAREGAAHRAAPYFIGGLRAGSGGGSTYDDGDLHGSNDDGTALISIPDDALSPVLARLPSAADVVHAAATCRRWARVVAKDAAVLSGALPLPSSLPGLTLGFFYQGSGGATRARSRRRPVSSDAAQRQPCFVPTAAAARLTGLRCPS